MPFKYLCTLFGVSYVSFHAVKVRELHVKEHLFELYIDIQQAFSPTIANSKTPIAASFHPLRKGQAFSFLWDLRSQQLEIRGLKMLSHEKCSVKTLSKIVKRDMKMTSTIPMDQLYQQIAY